MVIYSLLSSFSDAAYTEHIKLEIVVERSIY